MALNWESVQEGVDPAAVVGLLSISKKMHLVQTRHSPWKDHHAVQGYPLPHHVQ